MFDEFTINVRKGLIPVIIFRTSVCHHISFPSTFRLWQEYGETVKLKEFLFTDY